MNSQTYELFPPVVAEEREAIGPCAYVLRGYAIARAEKLLHVVRSVEDTAPFRHMMTPGGFSMSVAMTNCGDMGWVTDRCGYRYSKSDPTTGAIWPAMDPEFIRLAQDAADAAGFPGFRPDACLINRYLPGSRLTLHQDRNELDFSAPIVSVSLGVPAIFLFGGNQRTDKAARIPLSHGDVVVWGGQIGSASTV